MLSTVCVIAHPGGNEHLFLISTGRSSVFLDSGYGIVVCILLIQDAEMKE